MIHQWKRALLEGVSGVFERGSCKKLKIDEEQAQAHRPHREQRTMFGNERVLHFASLAKYAVAS